MHSGGWVVRASAPRSLRLLLLISSVIWWNIDPVCSFGMLKTQQTHSHRRALILLMRLWLMVDLLTDSGKILEQVYRSTAQTLHCSLVWVPHSDFGEETSRSEFFISIWAPLMKRRKSTAKEGIWSTLTSISATSSFFLPMKSWCWIYYRHIYCKLQTTFVLIYVCPYIVVYVQRRKPTRCYWMVYCTCNLLNMFRALIYAHYQELETILVLLPHVTCTCPPTTSNQGITHHMR